MERLKALFQTGLGDPYLFANLFLRFALLVYIGIWGDPRLGDSDYFLGSMRAIWDGTWGGYTFRGPGYAWLLALCGGPWPTLALQTLAVWLVGAHLRKHVGRTAAILWCFDPVFLVYSHSVMSDALFAVAVYAIVVCFSSFLRSFSPRQGAVLGGLLAIAMLFRPVAIPFAFLALVFAVYSLVCRHEAPLRRGLSALAITVGVAATLVFPRLAWNASLGEGWTIASQGAVFQMSVAGVVENVGQGLSYLESEAKWVREHPDRRTQLRDARESLVRHWTTWSFLTAKGLARTFFGHVNVEVSALLSGHAVAGPGWFSEGGSGTPWSTGEKTVWIAGLLLAIGMALTQYGYLAARLPKDLAFLSWILLSALGFAAAPQVFGDARFRLPVLALLFAAAVIRNRAEHGGSLSKTFADRV